MQLPSQFAFIIHNDTERRKSRLFLFCFVLFCFVLFCFVLFCFVLFCFVLFCFVCFLQSPPCAANCLQHIRSFGQCAILCKSRANTSCACCVQTHRALPTLKHIVRFLRANTSYASYVQTHHALPTFKHIVRFLRANKSCTSYVQAYRALPTCSMSRATCTKTKLSH